MLNMINANVYDSDFVSKITYGLETIISCLRQADASYHYQPASLHQGVLAGLPVEKYSSDPTNACIIHVVNHCSQFKTPSYPFNFNALFTVLPNKHIKTYHINITLLRLFRFTQNLLYCFVANFIAESLTGSKSLCSALTRSHTSKEPFVMIEYSVGDALCDCVE